MMLTGSRSSSEIVRPIVTTQRSGDLRLEKRRSHGSTVQDASGDDGQESTRDGDRQVRQVRVVSGHANFPGRELTTIIGVQGILAALVRSSRLSIRAAAHAIPPRLAYQSVGVIYGDIGTSPLYVYSGTFEANPSYDDLVGVLSIILWTLTLMVSVKYVLIVLQADNEGEGGTFAVYSLLSRYVSPPSGKELMNPVNPSSGQHSPADRQGSLHD